MNVTKSFYDFCIPYNNDTKKLKCLLKECIECKYCMYTLYTKFNPNFKWILLILNYNFYHDSFSVGYRTIAIEQKYDHTKKDSQNKKSNDIFPSPINLDDFVEFKSKLKILQRLTIIYSDVSITHSMVNSSNLRKYHLIAGIPKTDQALNVT